MSAEKKAKRKTIFERLTEDNIAPEPKRDQESMPVRLMMVRLHELEEENKRLRNALTEATIQLNAARKQVAVAKKLLGEHI